MPIKGKRNFDHDAWHVAGTLEWRIPESPWTLRTGVTYTDAEKANGVGQFARNPIGNTRGRFNFQLTQISTMFVMARLWAH